MLNFNEDFLQFVWQYKLLRPGTLKTVNGLELEILKPGEVNTDSGADFFNAQVKLNNLKLAGNVEIHVNSSDWLKHKHQYDKTYDNIILHAVYNYDKQIPQNVINNVEVLELKEFIDHDLIKNYKNLINAKTDLPCKKQLHLVNELKVSSWINRTAIERLESKVEIVEQIFNSSNNDFAQTFYTLLLKNFGFKVNAIPFEMLASCLNVNVVLKHVNSLLQVEALFLGTAGMLNDFISDKYIRDLQNEFEFLKNKYKLSVLDKSIFKNSRMRPANFPGLRLAQFAQLINSNSDLLMHPQNLTDISKIKNALNFELQGYWKNHYKAGGKQTQGNLKLGDSSVQNILVNTFSYFFFFYGRKLNKPEYENLALLILEEAAYESNSKTKKFPLTSFVKKSALLSQGLIQLHDNYCSKKRCLKCGIGAAIIQSRA